MIDASGEVRVPDLNKPPSLGAVECREVHGTFFYSPLLVNSAAKKNSGRALPLLKGLFSATLPLYVRCRVEPVTFMKERNYGQQSCQQDRDSLEHRRRHRA